MTSPCHANAARDATGAAQADREWTRYISGAACGLQFAAAPTFAVMALLTVIAGHGASDILCAAALDASPLTGMVPMYVLMSAFHAAPWLRLLSR
jgi:hypothetical protein